MPSYEVSRPMIGDPAMGLIRGRLRAGAIYQTMAVVDAARTVTR